MKNTFYIYPFIFLHLIFNWSCKDSTVAKNNPISTVENDSTEYNLEKDSTKIKLTKFEKIWVKYVDENGRKLSELELYISEYGDTLCWNRKIYTNGEIDYSKSNFYDFEAKMAEDSIIKGRITLHLELDHSIKDPVVDREITVDFVNQLGDSTDITTFESKGKNYVDFEFKNNNDTIIGLVTEYRRIDLLNAPDSTRLIWSKLPIDSESETENVFINVHGLDKNKR
ncbi:MULTISPECIES: hypothetical protein [unclassified Allomuricauda]|uniref:hypothetical protein n=1 Tax=unclassified Allomuricauda TaxID=2615049 RepID=UPI002740287E|nr:MULTISPECIES: hypothetical protein [unclassified Allomuricauda]